MQQALGQRLQAVLHQVAHHRVVGAHPHAAGHQVFVGLPRPLRGAVGLQIGLLFEHEQVLRVELHHHGRISSGLQRVNAALHQAVNGVAAQAQLAQHQLFGQVQSQAFERLVQGVGVLMQGVHLQHHHVDQLVKVVLLL